MTSFLLTACMGLCVNRASIFSGLSSIIILQLFGGWRVMGRLFGRLTSGRRQGRAQKTAGFACSVKPNSTLSLGARVLWAELCPALFNPLLVSPGCHGCTPWAHCWYQLVVLLAGTGVSKFFSMRATFVYFSYIHRPRKSPSEYSLTSVSSSKVPLRPWSPSEAFIRSGSLSEDHLRSGS